LYVASEHRLPLVPWDESNPSFNVEELAEQYQERVRRHFAGSHVYGVGAHTHCACGFSNVSPNDDTAARGVARDITENEMVEDWLREQIAPEPQELESMKRLSEYLGQVIRDHGPVESFGCWDGEEDHPVRYRGSISHTVIANKSFFFWEKALLLVT